jgi:HEAT repeat protein
MLRLLILSSCTVAVLAGCRKSQPTLVGDHPPSHWVAQLRDADPKNRKRAAQHLGNAGAVDSTIVPALAEAARDTDPSVRKEAAVALMKIGPAAKSARATLSEATSDSDPGVREAAVKAIERIDSGKK